MNKFSLSFSLSPRYESRLLFSKGGEGGHKQRFDFIPNKSVEWSGGSLRGSLERRKLTDGRRLSSSWIEEVSLIHEAAAAIVFLVRRRKVRVSYRIEESGRGARAAAMFFQRAASLHSRERCRNRSNPGDRGVDDPLDPRNRESLLAKPSKLSQPSEDGKVKFFPPCFSSFLSFERIYSVSISFF